MSKQNKEKEIVVYDKKLTTLDAIWVFILCAIVASLVATIISGVVLALVRIMFSTGQNITHNKYAICFQYLMMYLAMLYTLYLYAKKKKVNLRNEITLTKPKQKSSIFYAILCAILCIVVCAPFISLVEHSFSLAGYHPENVGLPLQSAWDLILNIIFVALLPAVVEEMIYRGVILRGLSRKCKPWLAILLTSIVFMLAHGSLEQCVYQLILGLVLSYIAYSTGNIMYSMIAHFTNNFVVIILSFIQNHTRPWTIDFANIGNIVWVVILFVLGLALLIGLLYLWTKKRFKTEVVTADDDLEGDSDPQNKKWNKEEILFFTLGIAIMLAIWVIGTVAGF